MLRKDNIRLPNLSRILAACILTPVVALSVAGAYAVVRLVDSRIAAKPALEASSPTTTTAPAAGAPCNPPVCDASEPEPDAEDAGPFAVCEVETDLGCGAGAVLRSGGGLCLYMRESALHGAKDVCARLRAGKRVRLGGLEVATNRDLVRFAVANADELAASFGDGGGRTGADAEGEAARIAALADGAEWIEMDFEEYSLQSGLLCDVRTMLGEIGAMYARLDDGEASVARACDAAAQYRLWPAISDMVEKSYACVNAAKAKVDELSKIDGDYARLKFDQLDEYLRLQNWKIETLGWIDRRVECTKSELQLLRRGGVDVVRAGLGDVRRLMGEAELRIPSFRREADELARAIDGWAEEKADELQRRCDRRGEDLARYAQRARDAVEEDYQKMLNGEATERRLSRRIGRGTTEAASAPAPGAGRRACRTAR